MKKLREAIQKALSGAVAAVNAGLKGLPPVEQFDANDELKHGLRLMRVCGADLCNIIDTLAKRVGGEEASDELVSAMAEAVNEGVEAKVKAGELFSKTDHEAAVNAAVSGAEKRVTDEVTARFERTIKAGEKRSELLKDVPTVLAEKFSVDALLADDAATSVEKFKERMKKCNESGVTLEKSADFLAEIAGLPLDAEGDKAFLAKFGPVETAFNAAKAAGGKPAPAINPAGGAGGTGGDKSRARLI